MLLFLAGEYRHRGWVQQYHIGALRNNNSRMLAAVGPDIGFDSINDRPLAEPLSRLLDARRGRAACRKPFSIASTRAITK